jgi:hypothetical protein
LLEAAETKQVAVLVGEARFDDGATSAGSTRKKVCM